MISFDMLVVLYILVMNDLSLHAYPSLSMFEIITLVAIIKLFKIDLRV